MPVHEATLKQAIDLSLHLPRSDKLHLITILSKELRDEVPVKHLVSTPAGESDKESQLLADLQAAGMLVEPSSQMLAYAAAWDALPKSEKQKTTKELRNLELDIPLSEIIMHAREFRPGWEWLVEA